MRDRDKIILMITSVPVLLLLQQLKLCYTDWLSMTICYVGITLILGSLTFIPELLMSANWSSVEGKIITSEKRSRDSNSSNPTLYARVEYKYLVDGMEYISKRIKLGVQEITDSSDKWLKGTLEKYPIDKVVEVYYNPRDPTKAILEKGMNIRILGFFLLGLLFYMIGLVIGNIWLSAVAG